MVDNTLQNVELGQFLAEHWIVGGEKSAEGIELVTVASKRTLMECRLSYAQKYDFRLFSFLFLTDCNTTMYGSNNKYRNEDTWA